MVVECAVVQFQCRCCWVGPVSLTGTTAGPPDGLSDKPSSIKRELTMSSRSRETSLLKPHVQTSRPVARGPAGAHDLFLPHSSSTKVPKLPQVTAPSTTQSFITASQGPKNSLTLLFFSKQLSPNNLISIHVLTT